MSNAFRAARAREALGQELKGVRQRLVRSTSVLPVRGREPVSGPDILIGPSDWGGVRGEVVEDFNLPPRVAAKLLPPRRKFDPNEDLIEPETPTCKPRPENNSGKGGGSRVFIPWCRK